MLSYGAYEFDDDDHHDDDDDYDDDHDYDDDAAANDEMMNMFRLGDILGHLGSILGASLVALGLLAASWRFLGAS